MTTQPLMTDVDWTMVNQRYLTRALDVLRGELAALAAHPGDAALPTTGRSLDLNEVRAFAAEMAPPSALELIRRRFGLSPFEHDLLLLCAAVELDSAVRPLLGNLQGNPAATQPTFSLALSILSEPHWNAITPAGPLRSWRLIEVGAGPALTQSPLRIDERVLHFIAGVPHLDDRLRGLISPLLGTGHLVPTQAAVVDQIVALWREAPAGARLPIVQLTGRDEAAKRTIASSAGSALGLPVSAVEADVLPTAPSELDAFARLWEREVLLGAGGLYLDCTELDGTDPARVAAVRRLSERLTCPLIVASRDRANLGHRQVVSLDVELPGPAEQAALWQAALGDAASAMNGHLAPLLAQFRLNVDEIRSASAVVRGTAPDELAARLWEACRVQARARLEDLAQRISSPATWDDLVLPEAQKETLREIAIHVRQRIRVYWQWGFGGKGARGLGISALFAGTSGTGKTMAAEVLANELQLDLYRIDLSSVVSKYIGETEKNLRRLFDTAELGGAILLFDEADALFGKRSEVKDSHDRYANVEVSYLLQRMEAYAGLAILTTNLKGALDSAFLRRIRFVVQFPFPDSQQRVQIWRRAFPAGTPTEGLSYQALARLNVAGGNIRNIALNAAFLAAEDDEPVRMEHILRATRAECAKIEKPLTAAEVAGWL